MRNLVEPLSCTAIVCAYNEENTLGGVLTALLASPLVDEIVVVDDGSWDATPAVLQSFGHHRKIHPIVFPTNRGKGRGIVEGVLQARGEILLLVDADLLNFSPEYVSQLLLPLQAGAADMVIGYPLRKRSLMDMADPFRLLSGERALYQQDLLPVVPRIDSSGYGVETLINLHYRKEGKHVHTIPLRGLIHPIKAEKAGPMKAARLYTHEASQIIRSLADHYPLALEAYGLDNEIILWGGNQVSKRLNIGRLTRQARQTTLALKQKGGRWLDAPFAYTFRPRRQEDNREAQTLRQNE